MTRKLRFALTAVLLLSLIGGAGTAAAEKCDKCDVDANVDSDTNTNINDNDLVDIDDTLNDLNTNVLGVALQDSPVDVL